MHHFPGLDEETVLWRISYTNLNMYLATIPTYGTDENEPVKEGKNGDTDSDKMKKAFAQFNF